MVEIYLTLFQRSGNARLVVDGRLDLLRELLEVFWLSGTAYPASALRARSEANQQDLQQQGEQVGDEQAVPGIA